ncbi:MAG: hypothetical protein GY714_14155 [Desulfobacterales bacterium]|nr:hypothetical protein [Desulfobacterales bacterium]
MSKTEKERFLSACLKIAKSKDTSTYDYRWDDWDEENKEKVCLAMVNFLIPSLRKKS